MAHNTVYHKLGPGADDLSDTKHEGNRWTNPDVQRWQHWRGWLRLSCEALMVLTILGLALKIAMDDRRPRTGRNEPRKDFGFVDTVFMNDTRYASEAAFASQDKLHETLARWVPFSSKGRGYVKVLEEERPGLDGPPYDIDPLLKHHTREAYMVSGFHQLHCLSTIMASYARLRQGKDETEKGYHIAHCFDYLRQGILCSGDTTLEGNNSMEYPGVDIPWGTAHRCVDWAALRDWADDRTVWAFPPIIDIL